MEHILGENNPKKTKNQIKTKYNNKQSRYKTNEEIPDLSLFSNLVACTLSKKLEFEAPARPHWRTVNLSFLGLVKVCLAYWQVSVMAPAPSFPLHSGLRHTLKAAVTLTLTPPTRICQVYQKSVTTLQLDASLPILI